MALNQLFRHRFLAILRAEKLINEKKLRQFLAWKHSGFSLHASTRPVRTAIGRQQLAEYSLRAPFSLEKITWIEKTKRVIYHSRTSWRTSWRTKRNFQIFTATGFLAAAVEHISPPPDPPYDIETMEPLPWERRRQLASSSARSAQIEWQAPEFPLDDERIHILDSDPAPPDELPDF